jgi:succinate dehydrogenase/fumarate reductase iron-sulfur protein
MQGAVKIFRFNPMYDKEPYYQTYEYEFQNGMTVLDVLNLVRDTWEPTLSYDWCCRNGHCGLCGISINEKPALACRQAAIPADMVLEPLKNISVVKDLTIDREEYERNRPQLRLFLERQCDKAQGPEAIDMQKYEYFKVASRCIECLCCISACPEYKKHPHVFPGPAAFALEARHFFDPRDELSRELLVKSEGIEHCADCGLCSKVCQLGADPAGMIKKMKAMASRS